MTFTRLFWVEVRRVVARRMFRVLTGAVLLGSVFTGTMVFIASGFSYREMEWIVGSAAFLLIVGGWVLGASAVGAEWPSRSMTGTLMWEPRRRRLLAAKTLAGGTVSFAWAMLLLAAFSAALYPAAVFEGSTSGLTSAWWSGYILLGVRSSVVIALAFLFASSLAMIGRNTAAALGIGLAQLAVIEGLIRGLKPGWAPWLIGDNAGRFLIGDEMVGFARSQGGALVLLIVYAAVGIVLASLAFERREIA